MVEKVVRKEAIREKTSEEASAESHPFDRAAEFFHLCIDNRVDVDKEIPVISPGCLLE